MLAVNPGNTAWRFGHSTIKGRGASFFQSHYQFWVLGASRLLGVSGSPIYNLLAGCCSMFSSKLYITVMIQADLLCQHN